MTNTSSTDHLAALGSAAPSYQLPPVSSIGVGAYGSPAQFLALPNGNPVEELAELAAQVMDDPVAVRQLSDRVMQLLHQDVRQLRERHGSYGRRG